MSKEESSSDTKKHAGLIPVRPNADTEWIRLRQYVYGDQTDELTEVEKRLLTNDSEDLDLDPTEPTYAATMIQGAIVGKEPMIAGATFYNATMSSLYKAGEPAAALNAKGS